MNAGEQTGSGLLLGRVKGAARQRFFNPQVELLPGYLLRVGYEDAPGHRIERVGRSLPKGGRYSLPPAAGGVPKGTPVFLIDRREKALEERIKALEAELPAATGPVPLSSFRAKLPAAMRTLLTSSELKVYRRPPRQLGHGRIGLWLSPENLENAPEKSVRQAWWWLSPTIFPDDEAPIRKLIRQACSRGGRTFVLNDPWQVSLFDAGGSKAKLWAGPFCNLANPLALETAASLG